MVDVSLDTQSEESITLLTHKSIYTGKTCRYRRSNVREKMLNHSQNSETTEALRKTSVVEYVDQKALFKLDQLVHASVESITTRCKQKMSHSCINLP